MSQQGSLFDRIGVKRVVNGVGPATRLGGLSLHPEVQRAMTEATDSPVRMDDLEQRAGAHLAALLGVEAAYVTSGAAAALSLGTAAALVNGEIYRSDLLPSRIGTRKKVVVLAAQRDPYDRAIEAVGGEIVTVGYPSSTHLGEVKTALDDDVAAVLYRPGRPGNHPSLEEIAGLANARHIPVIVDGALFAPPLSQLHEWFDSGASLVAMSGGKQFRGPQASGILCGKSTLIQLVSLMHQDMDEREQTWGRGDKGERLQTPPRHGVGRAMKVGREQIAGLLVAVERYLADPGAEEAAGIAELDQLRDMLQLRKVPHTWHETSVLGVPILDIEVHAGSDYVDEVLYALTQREIPIYLEESEAWRGMLMVHPMALRPGDARLIAEALEEVLGLADSNGLQAPNMEGGVK